MSSLTRAVMISRASSQEIGEFVRPLVDDSPASVARFSSWLRGMAGGVREGTLSFAYGMVYATATLTITSTGPADAQTFTLCGTTFTAKTTPAGTNHFQRSDTPATVAAAIAAIILASPTAKVTGVVSATSLLGVVTVQCLIPGSVGNGIQIDVGTLANTALSSGGFSGGSDGSSVLLTCGSAA